tara:strand:+ start:59 stop:436 length:378 start_codon:yes stop_codon:yes gene_type:complete
MSKKNYLFAPFKDDDNKIEEFNAVVNALKYVLADVNPSLTDADKNHYMESALHGLRVFIGRLESYYDVIISDLKAENVELKAENVDLINHIDFDKQGKFKEMIDELKAENKSLQGFKRRCFIKVN